MADYTKAVRTPFEQPRVGKFSATKELKKQIWGNRFDAPSYSAPWNVGTQKKPKYLPAVGRTLIGPNGVANRRDDFDQVADKVTDYIAAHGTKDNPLFRLSMKKQRKKGGKIDGSKSRPRLDRRMRTKD